MRKSFKDDLIRSDLFFRYQYNYFCIRKMTLNKIYEEKCKCNFFIVDVTKFLMSIPVRMLLATRDKL